MSLNFSTKASTLAVLRDNIVSARVLNLIYFTLDDWAKRNSKCLELIEEKLPQGLYIVRSSCLLEDSKNDSRAGQFLSLQNVKFENLSASIDKVIASYETPVPDDQILIQPMLKNVVRSGVAFTHDPVTCSPYFKINWANSHNTNIVTSGLGGRTWFMARNSEVQPPTEINGVVALMHELQNLFNGVPIDVEFAITKNSEGNETLWVLQARQLFLNETPESYQDQTKRIKKIEARVQLGMSKHPFLVGGKTVFGVMPDWNPAEIIGIRPKPLALSLYRELITDNIWAYQRYNYGYRNVRSVPLMQQFFGTPYILSLIHI